MSDPDTELHRKFLEFAKLLNIYLNHFPRHEKYALCNRIRNTSYDLYDHITEARKRYHKRTTLTNLDILHEQLRMQLHLAYELGYFRYRGGKDAGKEHKEQEAKRFLAISRQIDELGRMIGGWIKQIKAAQQWK